MQRVNPRSDCRVNAPNQCRKIGYEVSECGARALQYRSGYDTTPGRHDYGDINTVDFDENLRPPQRREFLFPAIYNGGCEQRFCNNSKQCPGTSLARPSEQTLEMFNTVFGSYDPYGQVTSVSPACSGVKCTGPNSAAGWQILKDGQPLWKH
jgi:hypothetical protein